MKPCQPKLVITLDDQNILVQVLLSLVLVSTQGFIKSQQAKRVGIKLMHMSSFHVFTFSI